MWRKQCMTILEKMSRDLGLSEKYILSKINRSYIFYSKHFTYNKRGKKREVYEPSAELKLFQTWVNKNILVNYSVSIYATAYEDETSIRKNAYRHKDSSYILHTDIRHFFESITFKQVSEIFRNDYSEEDIQTILKIVMLNGKVPTGSITAPRIANRVMYDFDEELVDELSKIQKVIYTRYADDIVISSEEYIREDILQKIIELLKKYGFECNKDKTYYANKRCRRNITGVVLDNNHDSISIGWRRYKDLKLKIYKYLKYGEGNKESIRGELAFLKGINGNKYLAIKNHYKDMDLNGDIF